jgi:UDP-N-acetylmuramate dehydrogenase
MKLSAGQLIQLCGFKGQQDGNVGTYKNHALILINYGGAKGSEVENYAKKIQSCVRDAFGIELEPEVNYVG